MSSKFIYVLFFFVFSNLYSISQPCLEEKIQIIKEELEKETQDENIIRALQLMNGIGLYRLPSEFYELQEKIFEKKITKLAETGDYYCVHNFLDMYEFEDEDEDNFIDWQKIAKSQKFKNALETGAINLIKKGNFWQKGDYFSYDSWIRIYEENDIPFTSSDGIPLELSNPKLSPYLYDGISFVISQGLSREFYKVSQMIDFLYENDPTFSKEKLTDCFHQGLIELLSIDCPRDHRVDIIYTPEYLDKFVSFAKRYKIDIRICDLPNVENIIYSGLEKAFCDLKYDSLPKISLAIEYLKNQKVAFDLSQSLAIKKIIGQKITHYISTCDMRLIEDLMKFVENNEIDFQLCDIPNLSSFFEEGIKHFIRSPYYTTYINEFDGGYSKVVCESDVFYDQMVEADLLGFDENCLTLMESCLVYLESFLKFAEMNDVKIELNKIPNIKEAFADGIFEEFYSHQSKNKFSLAQENKIDLSFTEVFQNVLKDILIEDLFYFKKYFTFAKEHNLIDKITDIPQIDEAIDEAIISFIKLFEGEGTRQFFLEYINFTTFATNNGIILKSEIIFQKALREMISQGSIVMINNFIDLMDSFEIAIELADIYKIEEDFEKGLNKASLDKDIVSYQYLLQLAEENGVRVSKP